MNERVKRLAEEASQLSPVERAELVEGILASFDTPNPEIDKAWLAESIDRLAAHERGEIGTADFDAVLAKHGSVSSK